MKTITISDLHGSNSWKDIINKENDADKFVFIGDYFDSFHIKGDKQIENFRDIIQFKKDNMDKAILFIGNHDGQYGLIDERCSGFQSDYQFMIKTLLTENKKIFQMCYVQDNFLFSHAGVTKTWCKNNDIDLANLEESINDLWIYRPNKFKFTQGKNRDIYGNDITQTPIWVRPRSLFEDGLDGYIHIVGHTAQDKIMFYDNVVLTDTLGTSGEYLTIIDGKMSAKKITIKK